MGTATDDAKVVDFISKWRESGGAERPTFQSFIGELCGVLGVAPPDVGLRHRDYVFERDVTFRHPDGPPSRRHDVARPDRSLQVRLLRAGSQDLRRAKRLDRLPASLRGKLKAVGRRGPQKAPTKELISIRLSREVLESFRATGRGRQGRIDRTLRRSLSRKAASR